MNKFTIRYPNGIKRHVTKQEILLLGSSLQQVSPKEYKAALPILDKPELHYLAGQFILELKGKKTSERLESPSGMIERLNRAGVLA